MKIVIGGGGTAGHVYPGLALARALRELSDDVDILYIGSRQGVEAQIVPREGYRFLGLNVKGLRRRLSPQAAQVFLLAGKSSLEARKIIKRFGADVVVGLGGYVSLPVGGAAYTLGIPLVVHEQNSIPGLANRVLGKVAAMAAVAFRSAEEFFPRNKATLTGNPIRPEITDAKREEALEEFGLDGKRKTVLVFGGSRGARHLNQAFVEAYNLLRDNSRLQIIHLTGPGELEDVESAMSLLRSADDSLSYQAHGYCDDMGQAYAASDLAVCRAGAMTIAEITARGLPSLLVPYPYATANHQEKNAEELVKLGAARMVLDRELTGEILAGQISELSGDQALLDSMGEKACLYGKPDAAKRLAELVMGVAGQGRSGSTRGRSRKDKTDG